MAGRSRAILWTIGVCACLAAFAALLLPATASAAESWANRLTQNSVRDGHIALSDKLIVWSTEFSPGDFDSSELHYYDIARGSVTRLTYNTENEANTVCSGYRIAWFSPGSPSRVVVHDVSTGETSVASLSSDYPNGQVELEGEHLVWIQQPGSDLSSQQIVLMDLQSGTRKVIASSANIHSFVMEGNRIAWSASDSYDYYDSEIYLYNIGTGATQRLTYNSYYDSVGDLNGEMLTWEMFEGTGNPDYNGVGDWEIYARMFSDATTRRITNNAFDDRSPHALPGHVAWFAEDGPVWNNFETDVYLHKISTAATTKLTDSPDRDVVWDDQGLLLVIGKIFGQGLWVYDASTGATTQLSAGLTEGARIAANNLAWTEGPWDTAEVYYADLSDAPAPHLVSPFAVAEDGYSFKNFEGSPDWDLFSDVFGGGVSTWSLGDQTYYNLSFRWKYGGGVCYGMAATAGLFYRGYKQPLWYQSGASTTWQLDRTTTGGGAKDRDESIERLISKYHYFQYDPEIYRNRSYFTGTDGADEMAVVRSALATGWSDPVMLGLVGPWGPFGKLIGHRINIIGLWNWAANDNWLDLYDNNVPGQVGQLRVGPTSIGWPYFSPLGAVTNGNILKTSYHEKESIQKLWGANAVVMVSGSVSPDISLLHTNSAGLATGTIGAEYVNEIPGAERIVAETGLIDDSAWKPMVEYYLPVDDEYRIDITTGSDGKEEYHLFNQATVLEVETDNEASGSTSTVVVLADGKGFSFSPFGSRREITARLSYEVSDEESRGLEVSGVMLDQSKSVSLKSQDGFDGFEVIPGASEGTFQAKVKRTTPEGEAEVVLGGLPTIGVVSEIIRVPDWSLLAELPVFVSVSYSGGSQQLLAFNSTAESIQDLLKHMLTEGEIANSGLMRSVWQQIQRAPLDALTSHLTNLTLEGQVSADAAAQILAAAKAWRAASGG